MTGTCDCGCAKKAASKCYGITGGGARTREVSPKEVTATQRLQEEARRPLGTSALNGVRWQRWEENWGLLRSLGKRQEWPRNQEKREREKALAGLH